MAESQALARAKPRTAAAILKLYRPFYEDRIRHMSSYRELDRTVLEDFRQREAPEQCYRWLIELDCGCITDAITIGHNEPTECVDNTWHLRTGKNLIARDSIIQLHREWNSRYSNSRKGYVQCSEHERIYPIREIAEWIEGKDNPGYVDKDGIEHEPYGAWTVKLSCGHYDVAVITPVGWKPGDDYAPHDVTDIERRLASDGLDDEIRAGLEESLVMLEYTPPKRDQCWYCVWMRRIVAYRPVGPLVRPKPEPKPPSRATLTRRMNAANANAARLRKELAEAEAEAVKLRQLRDSRSPAPYPERGQPRQAPHEAPRGA
jgi:hypothetical protein